MTLPDERYRSLVQTKKFLVDLLTTPRVPKIVKQRASGLLRHWPDDYHLKLMCHEMPDHFAENMEPVYRLIRQYEEEQKNESGT